MRSERDIEYVVPVAPAATVALAGCQDDSAGPEEDASVEDVAEAEPDDPEEYGLLGQEVTVSAEITEVVADGAFWLGGECDFFGEGGAPVVSATGTSPVWASQTPRASSRPTLSSKSRAR